MQLPYAGTKYLLHTSTHTALLLRSTLFLGSTVGCSLIEALTPWHIGRVRPPIGKDAVCFGNLPSLLKGLQHVVRQSWIFHQHLIIIIIIIIIIITTGRGGGGDRTRLQVLIELLQRARAQQQSVHAGPEGRMPQHPLVRGLHEGQYRSSIVGSTGTGTGTVVVAARFVFAVAGRLQYGHGPEIGGRVKARQVIGIVGKATRCGLDWIWRCCCCCSCYCCCCCWSVVATATVTVFARQ